MAGVEVGRVRDRRGKKLLFLAHCLLNQNAKAEGLAGYRGIFEPLIRLLIRTGVGLVQLPCPETACLGLARPLGTDTVEQYDTAKYRDVCRRLAKVTVREIRAYQKAGYKVAAILGVEGSPSCSVDRAPRLVGGKRRLLKGSGLFVEALRRELAKAKLKVPFIGVPECPEAGDIKRSLKMIERLARL